MSAHEPETSLAIPRASAGRTLLPGGGRPSASPLDVTTIQPEPSLRGRTNGPRYVAPGSRAITSPGRARSSAAARLPPGGTRTVRPGVVGNVVSTVARGDSGFETTAAPDRSGPVEKIAAAM